MPRGAAPAWRARKEPVADDWLLASVNQAGGLGKHHPETGHYKHLVMRGLASREEAQAWKQALHRSAVYLHKWHIADVGVSAKIERAGKGYIIKYFAVNKSHAQAHIIKTYGADPARWPYHARGRAAT